MAPIPSASRRLVVFVKSHFCSIVGYYRTGVNRFCVYLPSRSLPKKESDQEGNQVGNLCNIQLEGNFLGSSCSDLKTERFHDELGNRSCGDLRTERLHDESENRVSTFLDNDEKIEPRSDDVKTKILSECQNSDEILKELVSEGCLSPPHSIAYSKKIQSLCDAGQVDKAHHILMLIIEKNGDLKPHYFNCIIGAFAKAGRLNESLEVCTNMQKYGFRPHQTTYHTLMSSYLRQGKVFEALDMFDRMKQDGWKPNEVTSSIVAYGMCKAGHSDQIRALFEERFEKSGTVSTSVCNALLESFYRSGDIEAAEELEKRIFSGLCLPNAYTYATMIRGRCAQGKADDARRFFLEMEKKGCEPIPGCYGSLISLLCKQGKCTDAYDIFKAMLDKNIEAEGVFCGLLLTELCKKCMIDEAIQVCRYVVDKRIFVDDATYVMLLEGLSKVDRLDEAKPLLQSLIEKGVLSNVRLFQQAMRSLERRETLRRERNLFVADGPKKPYEEG